MNRTIEELNRLIELVNSYSMNGEPLVKAYKAADARLASLDQTFAATRNEYRIERGHLIADLNDKETALLNSNL